MPAKTKSGLFAIQKNKEKMGEFSIGGGCKKNIKNEQKR